MQERLQQKRTEDVVVKASSLTQEVLYAKRPSSPRWVFSPCSGGFLRPASANQEAKPLPRGRPASAPLQAAVVGGLAGVAGHYGQGEMLAAGVMKDAFYRLSGLDASHGVKQCLLFPEMRALGLRRHCVLAR